MSNQATNTAAAAAPAKAKRPSIVDTFLKGCAKGFKVGIPSLGDLDTIAPAVQKGNKGLLDWINQEIVNLGKENFFHQDYAATLAPVYGKTSNPDDLVVEGGKL